MAYSFSSRDFSFSLILTAKTSLRLALTTVRAQKMKNLSQKKKKRPRVFLPQSNLFLATKNIYSADVLFCKVKLSKMAFIKTNKIKKQTALFNPIFHDIQLCFWFGGDSSPLKVLKMYFVFVWVCNQNIPDLICNVLIWHSNKDKVHFKDL